MRASLASDLYNNSWVFVDRPSEVAPVELIKFLSDGWFPKLDC